jgi:hypothetical protein
MHMTAPRCAVAALIMLFACGAAAQEVSMPLDTYNELRLKASPSPTPTPPPPAPWALESATIEIDAAAASARVTTRLTVSLFAADWQQIQLPAIGKLIGADLETLQGRVAAGDEWVLQVRGIGRHTLRLDSVVELRELDTATRPERVASVPIPPAARCTGSVTAAADVVEVAFAGGMGTGRGAKGQWLFVGFPYEGMNISLLGNAVALERANLPLSFTAESSSLATVARTRTRIRSWVTAKVRQGRLEVLRLKIPDGVSVVAVGGDPIGGWDVKDGILLVTPAAPVERSFNVLVSLTGTSQAEFGSPVVVPADATRLAVASAVQVEGDGLLELAAAASGRPPDERERASLPPDFRREARFPLVVSDPAQSPRWAVTWAEKGEALAAQVDRIVVDVLAGEAGQAAYQCWAEVRNSGATSLILSMPPGFELVEAARDGSRITAGVGTDGLVVPLTASRATQVVYLAGLLPLTVPNVEASLQVAVPALSAPIGRVEFRLALPPGRAYRAKAVEALGSLALPSPATTDVVGKANALLVQQVQAAPEPGPRRGAATFPVPDGWAILTGRWSALSARPGPIHVEVGTTSAKWGWF